MARLERMRQNPFCSTYKRSLGVAEGKVDKGRSDRFGLIWWWGDGGRGWAEQENEFSGDFNKLLKNYRLPYSCIGQLVPLCTNYLLGRFCMLLLFFRFHFMIFSIIWNRSAENRKSLPASQTFFANTLGCYTRKWNHATGFWFSISILWIHLWFSEIIAGKKYSLK